MRIMGVDPSISSTGISVPSAETVAIKPKSKGDLRLTEIGNRVINLTERYMIDMVVMEGLGGKYIGESARVIPMLHGVLRDRLQLAGIPFMLLLPATLKKFATGNGSADKDAMAQAARRWLGREYSTDDQCDADWLRVAGRTAYGLGELTEFGSQARPDFLRLPASHTEALWKNKSGEAIIWPVVGKYRPFPRVEMR